MKLSASAVWLLILTISLSGCSTIDFDYPRTPTRALENTGDTHLGRLFSDIVASHPEGESGFYPLSDGIDALGARLMLARNAERSIDLQYYLIKNDLTGRALIYTLLRAADRGVRVRLLLDDVFTGGYDAGMAALDSHPNFEIRIYNPFHRGFAGRARSGLTGFARVNRRMHNKSFTVDNHVTVVGGRNIADEYFGAREDAKFSDLDVVGVGPVVSDVSTMFDTYWNHETAIPLPGFAEIPDDPTAELERLRANLETWREEIEQSRYAEAVEQDISKLAGTDTSDFRWAPYKLVYDSPDKGIKARAEEAESILTPLMESLMSSDSELIVLSPYFVPRKSGVAFLADLEKRGVEVTVITNSLAANNQFSVHSGYAPSRKPLLEAGVDIFEVRPDADVAGAELFAASGAKATLHTKAFIVDNKEVFIGSFNFDPRSAYINTESGVIIYSQPMAQDFERAVQAALSKQTYEVFLNDDGKLRWRDTRGEREIIWEKEPATSWGQRFAAGFLRLFPIRGQL